MSWAMENISKLTISVKEKGQVGKINYLEIGDIDVTTKLYEITDKLSVENPTKAIRNDLVISKVRPTRGAVSIIIDDNVLVSNAFIVLRPKENVFPKYLFYSIAYNRDLFNYLEKVQKGTSYPSCREADVINFQIPLPPLHIQKRIAEILDAADALKRKDQQLLKKYDELAQAIFIDMFGDPVKNEKGWKLETIGEVCHYVKDGPHVSPKYTNTGIPFISVNNIIKGSIDLTNSKYISQEDFEMYSQKGKPEKNDLLYTKGGTTGFAKRVDVDYEFIQWVHVALLKFDKGIINPVFFEYMLNSAYCYHQSQLLTKGIANRDLVLGEMKKIIILLPPINIQNEFALRVSINENMKKTQNKTLSQSQNLFNTLIQKAFTGELTN